MKKAKKTAAKKAKKTAAKKEASEKPKALPHLKSFVDPEMTVGKIRQHMEEYDRDLEDKRRLNGKYAPATGTCLVCKGLVKSVIRFRHTGVIGGPPSSAHVSHWECQDCGLMYAKVSLESQRLRQDR